MYYIRVVRAQLYTYTCTLYTATRTRTRTTLYIDTKVSCYFRTKVLSYFRTCLPGWVRAHQFFCFIRLALVYCSVQYHINVRVHVLYVYV
jgi:hypothetical protein